VALMPAVPVPKILAARSKFSPVPTAMSRTRVDFDVLVMSPLFHKDVPKPRHPATGSGDNGTMVV
jgi:hypothetical protein